ncbi:AIR carboxylase family protein [Salmonella enterica subsp. enterica]|nr:AIR carboxylase family protein [Salmonella enterica subsp. enterica]
MMSKSDWATMQFAAEIFEILDVPHHVKWLPPIATLDNQPKRRKRTDIGDYCRRGRRGAPAGMIAAKTLVPVIGVPVQSAAL